MDDARRPLHGLPVVDAAAFLSDLHPAASGDDDEEAEVRAGLQRQHRSPREGQLGDTRLRAAPDGLVRKAARTDRWLEAPKARTEAQDLHALGLRLRQPRFLGLALTLGLALVRERLRMVESGSWKRFWLRNRSR